jgi:hypothetical protein
MRPGAGAQPGAAFAICTPLGRALVRGVVSGTPGAMEVSAGKPGNGVYLVKTPYGSAKAVLAR